MFKFKEADPTRRTPVYLQNHTKENFVWQLQLGVVMLVGLWVSAYSETKWEDRQRRLNKNRLDLD